MWQSRTKNDLIIEVWEKLDCESIGRTELEAIEIAVGERFGTGAVPSPMRIARLLADEGAELRHDEIMRLAVERSADSPYAPMFRNVIKTNDFGEAVGTLKRLENLRRKFVADKDKAGLKLLRETAIGARKGLLATAARPQTPVAARLVREEIADWFRVWLESPELFEHWVELRRATADFRTRFNIAD